MPQSGGAAVAKSQAERALRDAAQPLAPRGGGGGETGGEGAQVIKVVGRKTFILQGGVWTDTAFDPSKMKTSRVGFGSDDYFKLLSARPELGPVFALGPQVIVVLDGMAYETVAGAGDPLTLPATATPPPASTAPSPAGDATATPMSPSGLLLEPEPPAGNHLPTGVLAALAGLATFSLAVVVIARRR